MNDTPTQLVYGRYIMFNLFTLVDWKELSLPINERTFLGTMIENIITPAGRP